MKLSTFRYKLCIYFLELVNVSAFRALCWSHGHGKLAPWGLVIGLNNFVSFWKRITNTVKKCIELSIKDGGYETTCQQFFVCLKLKPREISEQVSELELNVFKSSERRYQKDLHLRNEVRKWRLVYKQCPNTKQWSSKTQTRGSGGNRVLSYDSNVGHNYGNCFKLFLSVSLAIPNLNRVFKVK